ncbi:NAD-binding protein, partial [Candidatus Microgenomates bacterium]|nr:NAD-binding protein [Candidatus Microgenomates bacterium]
GDNLIVVDFNPEVIEKLRNEFVPCLYGDVADPEIAELLNLKQAALVVSTVRDLTDNLFLLDALEKSQSKATVIITASDSNEAITLYERGAHHVSLPLTLEGDSIGRLIKEHHESMGELVKMREKKLGDLKRGEI